MTTGIDGREPRSQTVTGRPTDPTAALDHADGRVVLALDFGGSKTAAAVCSLGGARLRDTVVETTPGTGADRNLGRALDAVRALIGDAKVAAVGACTFGIPGDDGVALSPAIPGWEAIPLGRRLEETFDAPVALETDVKAAATAEARHGALAGADPAVYLNLGTGLAAALVIGGAVVRGAHGASGEIGYNLPRRGAAFATDGSHGPAVVEDLVSGMGLTRALGDAEEPDDEEASPRGDGGRTAALKRAGEARRLARLFEKGGGERAADALLRDFLDELSFQLVNLVIAVDPLRVAVGGGMVRSWPYLEGPLRRALDDHVPYPPELVIGRYPFDAALRGAIDMGTALAAALGPQVAAALRPNDHR